MANINMLNAVGGLWGTIIGWFQSFIGNFGLTIIIFTICLKLVLIPLDYWQKKTTRVNSQKQAVLAPEVEKIKKKYGNSEMANKKTMELYKNNNYSVVGTCFGLLVNMVLTLVIFFTLFSSLGAVSSDKIKTEYNTLQQTFEASYTNGNFKQYGEYLTEINNGSLTTEDGTEYRIFFENEYENLSDNFTEKNKANLIEILNKDYSKELEGKTDEEKQEFYKTWYVDAKVKETAFNFVKDDALEASKAVSEKYAQIKEGFLWINTVWRPDTIASIFPKTASEFISTSGYKFDVKTIEKSSLEELPQVVKDNDKLYKIVEVKQEESVVETKYIYQEYYTSVLSQETAYSLNDANGLFEQDYAVIVSQLSKDFSGPNGYYILIILSALVTVGSQLLATAGTKAKNKKGEEVKVKNNANIIMLTLLPLMMVYFTLKYTAVFALYIVVNSIMSTLIGFVLNLIMNKIDDRKDKNKTEKTVKKVEYSRY